jgi:putative tryptophan/tyrosine transport system substrate-binding protein
MRRREFIAGLGSAAAWPLVARAQQGDRVRRIGVLAAVLADDSVYQARHGAFQQELEKFGWSIGRNLRLDIRWAGIRPEDIRRHAVELAASAPDVILARGAATDAGGDDAGGEARFGELWAPSQRGYPAINTYIAV